MNTVRWIVSVEDEGKKIPEIVRHGLQLSSGKAARRLLEQGCVCLNGAVERYASRVVHAGDFVAVTPALPVEAEQPSIVYHDEALYILNKPAGLPFCQKLWEQLTEPPIYPVHRLDKGTSGLLLLARTCDAKTSLLHQFAKRKICKRYLAVVDGRCRKSQDTINLPLEVTSHRGTQAFVGVARPGEGKPSSTAYQVLRTSPAASLLCVTPTTGRTHQIRVHLASIGHPILGDYNYAQRFCCSLRPSRPLLHAWKLLFTHPLYESPFEITVPPPLDMSDVIQSLFGKLRDV